MTGKDTFEAIVAEHGALVLRTCRAIVGPADADDAWSETFIAAMRAYPELPAGANVAAWLVTIAHRKAIDLIRARNRRPLAAGGPSELPPVSHLDADPLDRDEALAAALGSLADRQRHAVVYHHIAGLPYAEIATIVGSNTAAVRRAAADGMINLRRTYRGARPRRGATT